MQCGIVGGVLKCWSVNSRGEKVPSSEVTVRTDRLYQHRTTYRGVGQKDEEKGEEEQEERFEEEEEEQEEEGMEKDKGWLNSFGDIAFYVIDDDNDKVQNTC